MGEPKNGWFISDPMKIDDNWGYPEISGNHHTVGIYHKLKDNLTPWGGYPTKTYVCVYIYIYIYIYIHIDIYIYIKYGWKKSCISWMLLNTNETQWDDTGNKNPASGSGLRNHPMSWNPLDSS